MEKVKELAAQYQQAGNNCAETVVKVFNDNLPVLLTKTENQLLQEIVLNIGYSSVITLELGSRLQIIATAGILFVKFTFSCQQALVVLDPVIVELQLPHVQIN